MSDEDQETFELEVTHNEAMYIIEGLERVEQELQDKAKRNAGNSVGMVSSFRAGKRETLQDRIKKKVIPETFDDTVNMEDGT